MTDVSHNLLSVLEAEKNSVREGGSWEWPQQLELAHVDLMGSREDPEQRLMVCLVNELFETVESSIRLVLHMNQEVSLSTLGI